MHTQIVSQAVSRPVSQALPQAPPDDAGPAVDEGLRSAGGIRWLHWVGAAVVGVSVAGLLADNWGALPAAVQFLVLAAGAVALQAAGDVARRRLHLPATAAALYFLFAALVPLLAWGAGWMRLAEAPLGWPSLALGLGALLWAARRVLVHVLEEHGRVYPAALGLLLLAPAVLGFVERRYVSDPPRFFFAAAVALGLVVRYASRHVNRTLFHRDRVMGRERPVHALPFALLALVYLLGLSLLAAHRTHFAVPLVFLAVALVDTGEEYYRALVTATSRVPERWPRRSVGLLAAGFALMAVAAAASPLDGGRRSAALVATVAAARLFAWAWRYRHSTAYGFALAAALAAYHLSPALMPEAVRALFWRLVETVGLRPGTTAVLGLADLGTLAALVLLGGLLRRRLTPAMQLVHVAALTFQALVVSAAVLGDAAAARGIVPAAVLLLAGGLFALQRRELVPAFYVAVAHAAFVWGMKLLGRDRLFDPEGFLALGAVSLLFAAAAVVYRRRRTAAAAAWIALPPLLGASAVGLAALGWLHAPVTAGVLLLTVAGTAFLTALAADLILLTPAAVLVAWAGWHLTAYGTGGETVSALALGGYAWLAAGWWLERRATARPESFAGRTRTAWTAAVALGAAGGLGWLVSGVHADAATVVTPYLALLGLLVMDVARRHTRQATTVVPAGALAAGLGLVALWPAAQLAATGADQTAVTLAILLAAIVEQVAAEVLERRGRGDLTRPCLAVGAVLAATAGVLAVASAAATAGSPWWPVLPGFLASLYFALLARDGHACVPSSLAAAGLFAAAFTVLLRGAAFAAEMPRLYLLPPGLALIVLSWLLRREVGASWRGRLFTAGAGCLYAVPVLGLLEEISWGWQILLLLLAVAFGAASFQLRSRSLLTLSTAAVVIDLAFFLLHFGRTAPPLLLWAVGIAFGLALMGAAMALEYRREAVVQKIRIWRQEICSW